MTDQEAHFGEERKTPRTVIADVREDRQVRAQRRRYAIAGVLLVAGVAISIASWYLISQSERRRIERDFEAGDRARVVAIEREIEHKILAAESFVAFYSGSKAVDRSEFRAFVAPFLSRHEDTETVMWVPRVSGAVRADFEASARGEGFADFQITETDPAGQIVRTPVRDEYFPVWFVEGNGDNENVLGLDVTRSAPHRKALDASRDNQLLISTVLRKAGAQVEIAGNGRVAVETASTADDRGFDVILMDMQMPEMDGYQATAACRRNGLNCPIIALTAHAMAGDREKCISAGCTDYCTKPIDRFQLITMIAHWAHPGEIEAIRSEFADDLDIADILDVFVAELTALQARVSEFIKEKQTCEF